MVLLVLEAHGALHFRGCVNKRAQRIARQRVVISAGIHVFKLAGFVVAPLRVHPLEEEAFNLVGRIQGVAFVLELLARHTA